MGDVSALIERAKKYGVGRNWNEDQTRSLLRFGRKNDGPWTDGDGNYPDDGDTADIIDAERLIADLADALEEAIAKATGEKE